jgi:hypothetical protein
VNRQRRNLRQVAQALANVLIVSVLDGVLATVTANVDKKSPYQTPDSFPETGLD